MTMTSVCKPLTTNFYLKYMLLSCILDNIAEHKKKKKSSLYYEKGSLLQNTTLFQLHISFNLTKHHNHQGKTKQNKADLK